MSRRGASSIWSVIAVGCQLKWLYMYMLKLPLAAMHICRLCVTQRRHCDTTTCRIVWKHEKLVVICSECDQANVAVGREAHHVLQWRGWQFCSYCLARSSKHWKRFTRCNTAFLLFSCFLKMFVFIAVTRISDFCVERIAKFYGKILCSDFCLFFRISFPT